MKKCGPVCVVALLSLILSSVSLALSAVIDSDGGTVTGPGGVQLIIPAGALKRETNVNLNDEGPSDIGVTLPLGHGFTGAVILDLGGATLTADAILTTPSGTSSNVSPSQQLWAPNLTIPTETFSTDQYLVSEVVDFGGSKRLALRDTASVGWDGVIQTSSSADSELPGLRSSGTYVFTTLPPDLGIIGVGVFSGLSKELPVSNANVVVVTTSVQTGTPTSTLMSAFDTNSLFVGQTNARGFAVIPGVIAGSTITALAAAPGANTNTSLLGAVSFDVPPLLPPLPSLAGKIAEIAKNEITQGLPYFQQVPPCPCPNGLAVSPKPIPSGTGAFTPGDAVQLSVSCNGSDVTSAEFSTTPVDILKGLITGKYSESATYYDSDDPYTAEVTNVLPGVQAGVVTAVAPNQIPVDIDIFNQYVKFANVNGSTEPLVCEAFGDVPVTVSAPTPTPIPTSTPTPVTINVLPQGNGLGTVTSAPAGLSCPPTCSAEFPPDSVITLTAAAAAGSTFLGWANPTNSCSFASPLVFAAGDTVVWPEQAVTPVFESFGDGVGVAVLNNLPVLCGGVPASATVAVTWTPNPIGCSSQVMFNYYGGTNPYYYSPSTPYLAFYVYQPADFVDVGCVGDTCSGSLDGLGFSSGYFAPTVSPPYSTSFTLADGSSIPVVCNMQPTPTPTP